MNEQWFCQSNGTIVGPFGGDALRQMAMRGEIHQNTLLRKGSGPWVLAKNVKGLTIGSQPMSGVASIPIAAPPTPPVTIPPLPQSEPVHPQTTVVRPTKYCFACGAQVDARAEICPKCGVRQPDHAESVNTARLQQGPNRVAACLLALFLGLLGAHKFYLGQTVQGVIYLLCGTIGWALVFPPMVVGVLSLVEGLEPGDKIRFR